MDEEREERLRRYKEAFREADAAAAVGDARGVMGALLQPHVLSGLMYRLDKHWRATNQYTVQRDDTEFIVVDSLRVLYERVATGDAPKRVGPYLFVTCRNRGYAVHDIRGGHKGRISVESLDALPDGAATAESIELADWEEKGRKLIRIIRKAIIPTLGRKNIQLVMDYIFEAHEKGTYATNQEIADALGVSQANVRAWKSKGFKRLPERLKKAGLLPADEEIDVAEFLGDSAGEVDDDLSGEGETPEE